MIDGHADYAHWFKKYPSMYRKVIMPASAHQLLMAGVTSARDLGAPLDDILAVRDAINRGEIPGPAMYVAGPFIQHEPYPGEEDSRWGVKGAEDDESVERRGNRQRRKICRHHRGEGRRARTHRPALAGRPGDEAREADEVIGGAQRLHEPRLPKVSSESSRDLRHSRCADGSRCPGAAARKEMAIAVASRRRTA
jgi:hypothetical protein